MRFRNTLLLAVILAGLGAYLYFVESKQIAEESVKKKIIELNPDDVTGVALAYSDREIVLEKTESGWRLTRPVAAPADDIAVKNLVRAIADAEVKKTIDDPPKDLASFGLAPPVVTVNLTAKGQTVPALKVGKTTAVSFSTYVQRADQPKVYLTGSGFQTGLEKQPKDLRDKKVVEFKDDDVTSIALRSPQGVVALSKADGEWRIDQPATYKADANAVRALLSTIRNLRATDFANDAPADADLATYGLTNPDQELVLRTADGKAVTLLLGKEKTDGDQGLFVKSGDKPTVFVVGKWFATDVAKGVNDLRDKTVLTFDPAAATEITVTHADGEAFTLVRSGDAWTFKDGAGAVNGPALDPFMSALSRLAGTQILAESTADLGEYGLARPALTIDVTGKDGPLGTIQLGSRSPNPPTIEYSVKRANAPTVFQLREFQYDQLDKKKADLTAAPAAPAQP